MRRRQPCLPRTAVPDRWPDRWVISDARNDAAIDDVLRRLPRGSGLIFRHYHLGPDARQRRYDALARIARARGHLVLLAGTARQARRWGADGAYGAPMRLHRKARAFRALTAHSLAELGRATLMGADIVLLSPVFATRSHPGATPLGPVRFRLIARRARVPVIALGGMTRHRAQAMRWRKWAAIDGA